MTLYFRHWYPRLGKPFERTVYHTCVHYGILWLGITVDRKVPRP